MQASKMGIVYLRAVGGVMAKPEAGWSPEEGYDVWGTASRKQPPGLRDGTLPGVPASRKQPPGLRAGTLPGVPASRPHINTLHQPKRIRFLEISVSHTHTQPHDNLESTLNQTQSHLRPKKNGYSTGGSTQYPPSGDQPTRLRFGAASQNLLESWTRSISWSEPGS